MVIKQNQNMTHNELHPVIQSWTDSDEFINSLISVAQEFSLVSTAPLIKVIFGLLLKTIKPEEFKTKLLASLPPDKQSEVLVSKLVNSSLLPIKGPLAESGIDISIIAPLDEVSAVSYTPPVLETLVENATSKSLATPLDEASVSSPLPVLEESTNLADLAEPDPLSASLNETPTVFQPAVSAPGTPTEAVMPESALVPSHIAPIYPTEITPAESVINSSFNQPPDIPVPLVSINESASINEPLSTSIPFVIHQEKPMESTVQSIQHKEELLRPLFYSKEEKRQDAPSFADLEFKPPGNNDNTSS